MSECQRYCPMCDEWMRQTECPKCGMPTDKALPENTLSGPAGGARGAAETTAREGARTPQSTGTQVSEYEPGWCPLCGEPEGKCQAQGGCDVQDDDDHDYYDSLPDDECEGE